MLPNDWVAEPQRRALKMVRPTQLSFSTLCSFYAVRKGQSLLGQPDTRTQLFDALQDCQDARGNAKKASKLRKFRENNLERDSEQLFEVYRLLLPQVCLPQGSLLLLYLL